MTCKKQKSTSEWQERIRKLYAKKDKWISVKDRLPKEDGVYDVCYEKTSLSERCCGRQWFISGRWVFEPWQFNLDIIYWMPLPEPPEEDGMD